MTTLLFNALSEPARNQLVAAFTGAGEILPIMSKPSGKKSSVGGWIFLALLSLGAFIFLLWVDYGRLFQPSQGVVYLIFEILSIYLLGWSILRAISNGMRNKAIPYQTGVYVFGSDMIDAQGRELQIYPLAEMQDLRVKAFQGFYDIELVFPERIERFVLVGNIGQQKLVMLQQAWDLARGGMLEGDLFAGIRNTPGWTDRATQEASAASAAGTRVTDLPKLFRRPALVALAFIVIAPPAWVVRNYFSDDAAYDRAEQYNDVWAAEAYIRGGGRHEEKARNVLLPRAAFTEAQRTGEPTKLQEFWTAYPQAPQVQQAKTAAYQIAYSRAQSKNTSAAFGEFVSTWPEAPQKQQAQLMHRDLAFAESQNNVTALISFIENFPQAPQVVQAREQISARYAKVRTDFEAQAGRNRSMRSFMANLIEWLEEHQSSEVQVRFHAPSSSQLEQVDAGIRVGGSLTSGVAPIAPHFTQERCAVREQSITTSLSSAFAAVFPRDVMQLRHMGRIAPAVAEQEITVPTIDVHYEISASGTMYSSMTDSRAYVGIIVNFNIVMRVPGGEEHSTRERVQPPRTFSVSTYGGISSDSSIYSTMADRAFANLSDELRRHFFRPGTPAYMAARRNF